jgi:hypothetical protein
MWIAILIAVIHVGTAVVLEILAGTINAITEALTLDFAILARWGIPSAGTATIAGRRGALRNDDAGTAEQSQCE